MPLYAAVHLLFGQRDAAVYEDLRAEDLADDGVDAQASRTLRAPRDALPDGRCAADGAEARDHPEHGPQDTLEEELAPHARNRANRGGDRAWVGADGSGDGGRDAPARTRGGTDAPVSSARTTSSRSRGSHPFPLHRATSAASFWARTSSCSARASRLNQRPHRPRSQHHRHCALRRSRPCWCPPRVVLLALVGLGRPFCVTHRSRERARSTPGQTRPRTDMGQSERTREPQTFPMVIPRGLVAAGAPIAARRPIATMGWEANYRLTVWAATAKTIGSRCLFSFFSLSHEGEGTERQDPALCSSTEVEPPDRMGGVSSSPVKNRIQVDIERQASQQAADEEVAPHPTAVVSFSSPFALQILLHHGTAPSYKSDPRDCEFEGVSGTPSCILRDAPYKSIPLRLRNVTGCAFSVRDALFSDPDDAPMQQLLNDLRDTVDDRRCIFVADLARPDGQLLVFAVIPSLIKRGSWMATQ